MNQVPDRVAENPHFFLKVLLQGQISVRLGLNMFVIFFRFFKQTLGIAHGSLLKCHNGGPKILL